MSVPINLKIPATVNTLYKLVLTHDKSVKAKRGRIMSIDDAFIFEEEGIFKYGLNGTKNYYTFHSMVMYAFPELRSWLVGKGISAKIQKGCINFKSLDNFPEDIFVSFIKESAKKDFVSAMRKCTQKK